ncbi:DUF411 domain-containing protein [Hylemonella gracilis]|uniref:DUF411 domain-containing protein n=1 Tax=Hylemonella gracilis TaxID=80880 RepID=A0A4V1A2B8_9BURK|nr:DUF411 domain-containing protein [Hylemonella gracilis]QBK05499.1 DUF411 domain-containing protein [Hylemonella gracilis]
MQRRTFLSRTALLTAVSLAGAAAAGNSAGATAGGPVIEVWKTPTCGCCKDWLRHLEAEGFAVTIHEVSDAMKNDYRRRLGLAGSFGSCHTGLVQGYVIEGHVPARDIHRLLRARPAALGLAVPGMPVGSPGMDGPEYGGRKDAYDVLLVQRSGAATVFQSHR